ncbi:FKBP-type peptidyl-prolyl cis-trans isomerase [Belliella kenyensis]|uniref:Peptidyl-prolyl cis-trans isomerase n=1 Tax=Belliella kenyensis TaxID=1472724 RepID=A0ABV8EQY5_9BACT|nr:FKBP-type peptidyl-prolyl cis-trans isomerase [Belliella kenyensis]MCH7402811.1 FKBP-type peptidyl-prolyl cis-trans isomerase [Belliella kenyensis]MDN3602517.1 FKBP-type peptidyl-prolyl cis-trans isomerase [Belliella kenyensis]
MRFLQLPILLIWMAMIVACMPDTESDYERIVERDNRLLQNYLERNSVNAIESPLGFYYQKTQTSDIGNQIVNNDIVGVYYEIKTTDGQLIETYMDESKLPRLFKHTDGGLIPRVINFAAGIAKEGEVLKLYSPSYLAYSEYSFEQLITVGANLVITVKYAKVYPESAVKTLERGIIESYIAENNLEGFERLSDGVFIKVLGEGEGEKVSKANDNVSFEFELKQLGESTVISKSNENSPFTSRIGAQGNLKFLDVALKDVKVGQEVEVFVPSHEGFGGSTQIFPFAIRRDLFSRNAISVAARPFEPIYFKAKIKEIK